MFTLTTDPGIWKEGCARNGQGVEELPQTWGITGVYFTNGHHGEDEASSPGPATSRHKDLLEPQSSHL